jgi:N-acyl homoserine lactone hydrolase
MKRYVACSVALLSFVSANAIAQSQPPVEVTLTRLDCGTSPAPSNVARFSDTFAWEELRVQLTFSCYLIKHGNDYMVWDAGNPVGNTPTAPKKSLTELLAQVNVKPEQVKFIGISHYHGDHVGQVNQFPQSTLVIGKGDWDALTGVTPNPMASAAPFEHWIKGGGKVDVITGDRKDVFGDGAVVVLSMPGHTPGHTSLLVRLKEMGNVLLSGDLAHFHENYETNGVPSFNTNRADSLASIDRFKQIAKNLKATVIIQHDARDVNKLPAFPAAAK